MLAFARRLTAVGARGVVATENVTASESPCSFSTAAADAIGPDNLDNYEKLFLLLQ